jgi:Predicted membrane-bound metal-dependent hydrolases
MFVLSALAFLPDTDFILHQLAPSIAALNHRGATHSLAVAVGVGCLAALVIKAWGAKRPLAWGVLVSAVVASHGLLDYFGDSNLGVALLWPISDVRLLAPWHVLPNPTIAGLLSSVGFAEFGSEFVVFLPIWLYAFLPRRRPARHVQNGPAHGEPSERLNR